MGRYSLDRRLFLTAVGSGLCMSLAGCSSDGDGAFDTETRSSAMPATETPTATITGTSTPSGRDGDGSGETDGTYGGYLTDANNFDGTTVDMRGQAEVTVSVGESDGNNGIGYSPPAVRVDEGATVRFEWTSEGGSHTVRHVEGVFDFGSPTEQPGTTFSVQFETEGVYKYYCTPHQSLGMKGVVAVGNSDRVVTDPGSVTTSRSLDGPETATLTADDGDDGDKLGYSTAISADGRRCLLGSFRDDDPHGTEAGSAYLFARTDEGWQQERKLVAPDGDAEDWFGWDVSLSGDGTVAVVSAFLDEDPAGSGAGAVSVFALTGNGWVRQAKLTGDDTTTDDRFGSAVALTEAGDTALVGAYRASDLSASGTAYVFERDVSTWTQTARITPDSRTAGDAFGRVVALANDGTTALVGADGRQTAYIFEREGENWRQRRQLTDPIATDDDRDRNRFGSSVALAGDGSFAFVGTDQAVDASNPGYVAVYRNEGDEWGRETVLRPIEGYPGDKFGAGLSSTVSGETLLIGAPNSNEYGENSGAATVFRRESNGWTAHKTLRAGRTDAYDDFGIDVGLTDEGMTGLVGARDGENEDDVETGAAYIFDDLG